MKLEINNHKEADVFEIGMGFVHAEDCNYIHIGLGWYKIVIGYWINHGR